MCLIPVAEKNWIKFVSAATIRFVRYVLRDL